MTTITTTPGTVSTSAPDTSDARAASRSPVFPLGWLRAVAALAVVTFHAYQNNRTGPEATWPWSGTAHQLMLGTDLFVDMFFVLSGLVLWLPIARAAARDEPGRPGRVLLKRRMARLYPLYATVVLVVWAATNPALPGHWQDLVLHLSMLHVYSDQYIFWTNGPAWSLAVEFHFYVLMALAVPFVQAGVRRVRTRGARLAVASVLPVLATVTGVTYLAWATLVAHADPTNWSVWFSPLSRGVDFGVGMGLAVLSAAGVRLGGRSRAALAGLGLSALAVLVLQRPFTEVGEWWHPAYALAIAVGLSSIVLHDGPWPAFLDWRPLSVLGGLGYGIYLIHEPVMRLLGSMGVLPAAHAGGFFLVTAVLVTVPTVALAWLSSRTVEAAGLKLLALSERDGSPRDYYEHLEREEPVRTAGPGSAAGPR